MTEDSGKLGFDRIKIYLGILSDAQTFRAKLEQERWGLEKRMSDLTDVVITDAEGKNAILLVDHLRNLHTLFGLCHKSHKLFSFDASVQRTVVALKLCYAEKECNHPYRFTDGECVVCNHSL